MRGSDSREDYRKLDGFIVIDKPKGPTSHQVDYWVREILGVEKVGHVGTLDPNATGVLVMAVGKAVKLIDVAHEDTKEYVCAMRIHKEVSDEELLSVMKEFETEIYQYPPLKSAVAREVRTRRIYELELLERDGKMILFRARTDSGTYIRTLCLDIGYVLGSGAQMSDLRRTATGVFTEGKYMVTLHALKDAVELMNHGDDRLIRDIFLPMNYLFRDKPKIIVKKSAIENIAHGSDLYPGGIKAIVGDPRIGDRVCVLDENNGLVGTGKMLVHASEISTLKVVDFDRVMVEPTVRRSSAVKPVETPVAKPEQKVEVFHEKQKGKAGKTDQRGKVVRDTGKRRTERPVQGSGGKLRRDFRRPERGRDTGNGRSVREDARPKGKTDKLRKKKNKR